MVMYLEQEQDGNFSRLTSRAQSILLNPQLRQEFTSYFHRRDTFTLGLCNGCQMLSLLSPLIPGSEGWPLFKRNTSQQFEARVVMVQVEESPSLFLKSMGKSVVDGIVWGYD